jgi:hypothetical protein
MRDRIIIILALVFSICILFFSDFGGSGTRVYDCSISEISPDFPIEVKEECRRLRKEHYDNHYKNDSRFTI